MKPIGKDHAIIRLIKKHGKQNIKDGRMIVDELGVLEMYIQRPDKAHFILEALIVCEELLTETYGIRLKDALIPLARDVYGVSKKTFDQIAEKKNAGGLIAVIEWFEPDLDAVFARNACRILAADGLENPGNVGDHPALRGCRGHGCGAGRGR